MKWFLVLLLAVFSVPAFLPASLVDKNTENLGTWKKFDEAAQKKTLEIKAVVFGPVIRILGMLGIAYGVCMLVMGQTRQMMTFAGIGLLLNIIPFFIDSVFSAILPKV
jgi:hypothetical protein